MIVDLGTGDGRAAQALAATEPTSLVIGIDADAASMAETSRRAARKPTRGGLPNLLFVVAGAEAPPAELAGMADEVRILFPWGSLLRGVLGRDGRVADGIAALARPCATVSALVSVTRTDAIDGIEALDAAAIERIRCATLPAGLRLMEACPVDRDTVRVTRSTWGRRLLGSSSERPVWRLEFVVERSNTEADGRPSGEPAV